MKNTTKFLHVLLVAVALCASACSSPSDRQFAEQLAITYAVGKVVENNPSIAPRIVLIASQVEAFANGDTSVTVAALRAFILSKINFEALSPSDRLVVNILLDEIDRRLQEKIGAGLIPPEKLVTVRQFVTWVKNAAESNQAINLATR